MALFDRRLELYTLWACDYVLLPSVRLLLNRMCRLIYCVSLDNLVVFTFYCLFGLNVLSDGCFHVRLLGGDE